MENALRNNVTWVLLNDVDEFVHVIDPNKTLKDIVEPYEATTTAAISLRNTYYGVKDTEPDFDFSKPRLYVRDYVYRAEEAHNVDVISKTIVRPELIRYMAVHKVALIEPGSSVAHLDPFKDARSNHFSRSCTRPVKDTAAADKFASRLEERIGEVYHPHNPAQFYPTKIDTHCKTKPL